ncbi:MAG: hypothetical protein COW03_10825 [Cytophagales bacterium CG12_big_fil_rev_8_21_14_0_65_40_12]|nr:MAG: hypothetical protein COW03_10825 [Cytophagales bacterium CG12_big_fil_rev_8_21_14_0_65_40_12]PIW05610.1 MAG: hypothetical protein COW40_03970 [Cytophagales bacterium CG17_big_fil_post_rev_8_21_14_2_50_40_13]
MKRTKELGGKILKYAEERIQGSQEKSEKIIKYVNDATTLSKELFYSSMLLAAQKYLRVEPDGQDF